MNNLRLLPILAVFASQAVLTPALAAHPWQKNFFARAHSEEEQQAENKAEEAERTRAEEIRAKIAEYKAAQEARKLTHLKELCDKMVNHRQKEIDRFQGKIADSKLSDDQKAKLNETITEKEAALATAKTDCVEGSSIEELKAKIRDVQKKQRIFHSILPKLHALKFADKAQALSKRMENQSRMLQRKIDQAEAAGCDVTDEEAALAEFQAALTEAREHLNKAKELIAQIKDTEDPGALRGQIKAEMEAMRQALRKAHDAFKKIQAGLKECRKETRPEETTEPSEPEPAT